ncbi:MAG TPA: hypothetical protein VKS24_16125 [Bradyrhizobium sp.]|nr:hypothetical protein [Bradyrhizobium sp.]
MATAQIGPIAKDFNVGNTIIFFGGSTLAAALIIDSVANGTVRPLFGWMSDLIGREYTMAIAFGLGVGACRFLGTLGTAPWAFVLFAALDLPDLGPVPPTCTDAFGPQFAPVRPGLLQHYSDF